jgi:hypothetical protein
MMMMMMMMMMIQLSIICVPSQWLRGQLQVQYSVDIGNYIKANKTIHSNW